MAHALFSTLANILRSGRIDAPGLDGMWRAEHRN